MRLEIGGADLLAAGVPEGPAIGRALEETLRRKLDGLVPDRDEELRTALELARVIDDRSSCPVRARSSRPAAAA